MVWRLVFRELVGGFLFLPVWWYTRGLALMTEWMGRTVRDAAKTFALGVWVKNLFVPMYGDTEWSGRILSFFIRLVMIVWRGLAVGAWTVVACGAFIAYVLVLPLSLIGLVYHGVGTALF